jgi:hypothetical protein
VGNELGYDVVKKDMESGRDFEVAFAKEMGLEPVPNSGATWHSKLDLRGFSARWSLKWTGKLSYVLSRATLEEAQEATDDPGGGTGEMPLWAFDVAGDWYVLVRASDFKRITSEELVLSRESKAESKRRTADVPQLFREDV